MLILHSVHDAYSREFVEKYSEGNEILDWFNKGIHEWQYQFPSNFPTVVIDKPETWEEYNEIKKGENGNIILNKDGVPECEMTKVVSPPSKLLITRPNDWDEVIDKINEINNKLVNEEDRITI